MGTPDDDLAAFDTEWVKRRGFAEFVRRAWSQVEPARLIWGWHMDAICEHLEAISRREIRDLVINVPPGCSKSLVASVLWLPWMWTLNPSRRFIVASYSDDVVLRDARKSRTLVESAWFQARWPNVALPRDTSASKAVGAYYTTAGGMRYSTTTHGSVTGQHGDDALVDDPIDPLGAASVVEIDACLEWWTGTMTTRFRDHRTSTRTLIMQRLHERDLTTEFIRAGATMLCLPMRYERNHPHRWKGDPRTREGELLVPDRVPEEELVKIEKKLGPSRTASQEQQRPSPAGGGIIKREWLKNYWTVLPQGGTWSQSWDCSFKGKSDSDYVCGQVWYHHGPNHYLVDQVLSRMGFNDTLRAIQNMSSRYPRAIRKLVEDKANGPAIIETLRGILPGITEVDPTPNGGKEARARACEPLFAAGNVFLPHPTRAEYDDGRRGAEWVRGGVRDDAVEAAQGSYEWFMVTFPNADHDDCVDATTQYLIYGAGSYAQRVKAAVEKAAPRGQGGLHGLPTLSGLRRVG